MAKIPHIVVTFGSRFEDTEGLIERSKLAKENGRPESYGEGSYSSTRKKGSIT